MLYDSMIPVISVTTLRTLPGDACNVLKRAFMEKKSSSMGLTCGVYGERNFSSFMDPAIIHNQYLIVNL